MNCCLILGLISGASGAIAENNVEQGMNAESHQMKETVVLLHGLARTKRSMAALQRALEPHFQVCNIGYPSRYLPVEQLAEQAMTKALVHCGNTSKIHFVSHSMGGILLRYYLSQHSIANIGRVVMLGPPNHGSAAVDSLAAMPGFTLLNGPAGDQMSAAEDGFIATLPPLQEIEVGIIAGTKPLTPFLTFFLDGPNDGKVTVESAKLAGMTDFIEMPVNHTFMMKNKKVIAQVQHFLANGIFKH